MRQVGNQDFNFNSIGKMLKLRRELHSVQSKQISSEFVQYIYRLVMDQLIDFVFSVFSRTKKNPQRYHLTDPSLSNLGNKK